MREFTQFRKCVERCTDEMLSDKQIMKLADDFMGNRSMELSVLVAEMLEKERKDEHMAVIEGIETLNKLCAEAEMLNPRRLFDEEPNDFPFDAETYRLDVPIDETSQEPFDEAQQEPSHAYTEDELYP